MGAGELLAALRDEGERKAEAIREKADDEARQLRDEAAERLARTRERLAAASESAVEADMHSRHAEAERAARLLLLAGHDRLARRLWELSLGLLPSLRGDAYPEIFASLAGDLPPREWDRIRVSPADLELARGHFPGARIEPAPAISGGLEAATRGGELQVIDTFEKRLERGWPELLPLILNEVSQCVTQRHS